MLILSRRPDEALFIGPDIQITVLGIKGQQVRLGITAPKSVVIDRAEVHARKHRAPAAGTPAGGTPAAGIPPAAPAPLNTAPGAA